MIAVLWIAVSLLSFLIWRLTSDVYELQKQKQANDLAFNDLKNFFIQHLEQQEQALEELEHILKGENS